jgi:hypothetical protein
VCNIAACVADTVAAGAAAAVVVLLYAGLTGEVLPASIAKELSQLSELCVLRTGIRKHAEGFKARLVSLHPGLTVKSSARG